MSREAHCSRARTRGVRTSAAPDATRRRPGHLRERHRESQEARGLRRGYDELRVELQRRGQRGTFARSKTTCRLRDCGHHMRGCKPMRIGILVLGLIVAIVGCDFSGPVFTPKPGDYPCHRQDGSADPNANWCYPLDGSHTCCLQNYRCSSLEGEPSCSYQGNPDNGSIGAAQKSVPRTPESGRP